MRNRDMPAKPVEKNNYLIMKRGMYYAHNSCGYTSRVLLAGLYSEKYAKEQATQCDRLTAVEFNSSLIKLPELNKYLETINSMKYLSEQEKSSE